MSGAGHSAYEWEGCTKTTVVTSGAAKAHPYLPVGRDIPGPDTTARHGPRSPQRRKQLEPAWKPGNSMGERVRSRSTSPVKMGLRVPPTSAVSPSHREWDDMSQNGVSAAKSFSKYVGEGKHKEFGVETEVNYKFKKTQPIDVAKGRGGNLGSFHRSHAGMLTKSSLTFGRTG
ncbi:hypothetical protein CYMTET_5172 [Cymbomonas tetramitiformis]|uniref:Uncharacterized protein n=1 Tax=Cymbomonas tetramitiformis TaxID=36881 RepID=A0AAE0GZW5_9CHLO|nr:hypothetical protein CYMTET_5172 [Cymbomonas tetramitiformis]